MPETQIIGTVAALCTTAAFVPQAVKAIRSQDTRSLSLGMYLLFTVGLSLWLWYGILLQDLPIIMANSVTLGLTLVILGVKIRYDVLPGRDPKRNPPFPCQPKDSAP